MPIMLALNWKVGASIFTFGALWWITVGIGLTAAVSLLVAVVALIALGAIRTRRTTRADDAKVDAFLVSEPLDEAHFAKLRYLEAVKRVLDREASDQDWALINEHHERTPVA
jgi:hypothetical protein